MSARTAPHAIWILYGAVAVAVVITYARLPVEQLYHVSHGGLAGGFGRVLVSLGYPVSLGAIGIALVSLDRLLGGMQVSASGRRVAIAVTAVAVLLCATVAVPGVIDQDDLDAKPVNALAAVGVALALLLTVAADRLGRRDEQPRVQARTVLLVGAALVVVSLPWLGALLGFYVDRAPLLGRVFLAGELRPEPGQPDAGRSTSVSTTVSTASCSRRRPCSCCSRPARSSGWGSSRRRGARVADARLRRGRGVPGLLARAGVQARHDDVDAAGRHYA